MPKTARTAPSSIYFSFAAGLAAASVTAASPARGEAYSFVQIDATGATYTVPNAIDDAGQITGSAVFAGADIGANITHDFIDTGGTFTYFDVPGVGSVFSFPQSINESGTILGTVTDENSTYGFIRTPSGSISSVTVPGSFLSFYYGINASGTIVGSFLAPPPNNEVSHSFVDVGGRYTTLSVPGATAGSGAEAINDKGQIVGTYIDDSGIHAYIDRGGSFTFFDVGAFETESSGINDAGQVVGIYEDAPGEPYYSFVRDSDGSVTQLNVPGAMSTEATGINNLGQIVGSFEDSTGAAHGFLATPAVPEPNTIVLLAVSVFGLAVVRSRAPMSRKPNLFRKSNKFSP